jgi:hypothetical protein
MKINDIIKKKDDNNNDINNIKKFSGITTSEMTTFAELSILWVSELNHFNQSCEISRLDQLQSLLNCVGKWFQVYYYNF